MFFAEAIIHSKSKENADKPYGIVSIIHEKDNNDVIAEYQGTRYTAIFNIYVCRYYVDDIYGKLEDQHKCPRCGDELV